MATDSKHPWFVPAVILVGIGLLDLVDLVSMANILFLVGGALVVDDVMAGKGSREMTGGLVVVLAGVFFMVRSGLAVSLGSLPAWLVPAALILVGAFLLFKGRS